MGGGELVSIIMPVYNAEAFIEKAVESVLRQSYSNLELIVINDGSTDRSEEIIRGFSDTRIKLYSQKNVGVSKARNAGLDRVTGEFFCFLDADDFLPVNSLEARIEVFHQSPSISFVDGAVEERELSSGKVLRSYIPTFIGNPLTELLQLKDSCFCGQTWLIKTDRIEIPKFKEFLTHGEDLHFFIDLATQGGIYSYTDELILIYNRHDQSAMTNLSGLQKFYEYHLEMLQTEYLTKGLITKSQLATVRKKVKSILIKSYLKSKKVGKVFKIIFGV